MGDSNVGVEGLRVLGIEYARRRREAEELYNEMLLKASGMPEWSCNVDTEPQCMAVDNKVTRGHIAHIT